MYRISSFITQQKFIFYLLCSSFVLFGLLATARWAAADWGQEIELTLPTINAEDYYGYDVDIDGDTAVVGTARCNTINLEQCVNGTGIGTAEVHVRPTSGWANSTPSATLAPSDAIGQPVAFGNAVAIEGDIIVVAARYSVINGNDKQGAVYIFEKPAGGWNGTINEIAKLTASDGVGNDEFGMDVAISGDTIVVSAQLDDNEAGQDMGALYVFTKPATGWTSSTENAKLILNETGNNFRFGKSVAIDGDTIVGGSWLAMVNGEHARGAAYIFEKPSTGWANQIYPIARLDASDGHGNSQLGVSVAIEHDTIVVGAFFHNTTTANQGAAYIYEKPTGGWVNSSETVKLLASDGGAAWFGRDVSISADTVVVGADRATVPGFNRAGAIYVFDRPAAGWVGPVLTESQKLTLSVNNIHQYLGFSTAVYGGTIIAGAPQHDYGGSADNGGKAIIFTQSFISQANGDWNTGSTWLANAVPTINDDVFVSANHVVTLSANAQARRLVVERGATLIIPDGITLTVEEPVTNYGTIQQTGPINNGTASLPLIESSSNDITYIGTTITTGDDLGLVTVRVRALNDGEYCTTTGEASPIYARRCFEITPENEHPATIRLWALTREQNGIPESMLTVYNNHGDGWDRLTSTNGNDAGLHVYGEADTTEFGHFLLGHQNFSPTAVTLQSIVASGSTTAVGPVLLLLLLVTVAGLFIHKRSSAAA